MNVERELTREEAEKLLCEFGSKNKKEQEFTKSHLLHLEERGRHYFVLGNLSREEFINLIFNEIPNSKKVVNFEDEIKRSGYNHNYYLFLRDLNPNEDGSYYVENGKHRVTSFQNLIQSSEVIYSSVKAVICLKQPSNRF